MLNFDKYAYVLTGKEMCVPQKANLNHVLKINKLSLITNLPGVSYFNVHIINNSIIGYKRLDRLYALKCI